MKKVYSLMLMAVMLVGGTVKAQCTDYVTIPYSTGFEGIATGGMPACWLQVQTDTRPGFATFPSCYEHGPNARNGNVYFEMESTTGAFETFALPLMQNINGLKLTMWISAQSNYLPTAFEVGVLEDDSVFVPVDTLDLITSSNWGSGYHEYTVYFVNYSGYGERMAMRAHRTGNVQYTVMIDDITVSEDNGCYPLSNLHMVDADSSSITVAWTDEMNVGASYTVTYWTNGGDTIVDNFITDTFYTATGLNASSNYNFIVTPNCSTGDGIPASGSFRTTCGQLMVPFIESFESASALECWSMLLPASSTGYTSGNAHTGSGCFRFYYNLNPPQYLVTPPLGGTDSDGILVSFWYKKYSTNYAENFKVGYSTTTADPSAFTWGAEVLPTTTYEEFSAVYPAGVKYVAIQYMQNNGYYLYIDDFQVGIDNGCNKPNDAYIDSVGPYSASLRWTNGGAMATSYNLYYGTQNNIAAATVVNGISDTSYTLTGLMPQTTYYAWVRTDCSGDSSDAKAFNSFTTQLTCAPLTGVAMGDISYTAAAVNWNYNTTVGFSSTEVVITLVDNTDSTVAPVTVSTTGTSYVFTNLEAGHGYTVTLRNVCDADGQSDTAANNSVSFMTTSCSEIPGDNSTNQYIPTYTYYNYSYSQAIYTSEQMPSVDSIHGVAFNVTSASVANNVRTWDVYMGHTSASTFSGSSSWISVDSMTLVASNVSIDASTTGWKLVTFDNAFGYDGSSNVVIAIDDNTGSYKSSPSWASMAASSRGLSVYSDGTNYNPASPSSGTVRSSIPAVRFVADCDVPTCFAPMVVVDNVDSASISIHWNVVGVEDSWAIGIKAPGDAAYTYLPNAVTDTFYTFTGLNANTAYSIVVGSLCIDTLRTTVTVRTACGPMALPFFEDWESIPSNGAWPACWDSTMHHNTDPSVNWEYNHTPGGTYSMFLMASGDYNLVVSPAVPLAGDQISVNFWAYMANSTSAWMKVGVITNPRDTSTFVPLLTIPDHDGQFHEYEFTTTGLNPSATYHVAWLFYSTSTSYRGAIDDITIEQASSCPRPNVAVVDSTSGTEAYLSWTSTPAGTYEVAYSTVNDVTDSSVQSITVSDTVVTVTGLNAMTQYFFWVRALCGTDNSNWRPAGSAATQCDTTTCDVVIDMDDSYGDGWNGNAIYVYQAGYMIGEATIASGSTGVENISVCSSSPVEFRFHVGSFASEASVTIYDGGGSQLYTQSDMSSVSEGALLATAASPCPTCIAPRNITLTSVSDASLSISWAAGGSESEWAVTCNGTTVIVNTPSATFSGLDASTSYTVQISAICSASDTSFGATATFVTDMCASAVTVENWDSTMTAGTSSYSPVGYSLYNYSYVQTIIPASRMSANGSEITAMAFRTASTSAGSYFTNMDVYMANVSEDNLDNAFIMPDTSHQFVQVITNGDFSYTTVDWQVHVFDSTFTWDGTSNVLVAVNRHHGAWTSGSSFTAHNDTEQRSRYVYQDSGPYDPATVSGGTATSTVGDIRLISCGAGCPAPVISTVTHDYGSATVTVTGNGLGYELTYGTDPSNLGNAMSNTTGIFVINGLTPATQYFVAVTQLCDSGVVSSPVVRNFTTDSLPCFDPTDVTVNGTTFNSAEISWTSNGNATSWVVSVSGAGATRYDTATTNPYTVTNLYADQQYSVMVMSICGNGAIESGWSEPVSFTTDVCTKVSGVTVGDITATTATVSWNAVTGTMGYKVYYGDPEFYDTEALTADVAAGTTSYTITGLNPETPYEVYVRNRCTETLYSAVTNEDRVGFTTAAGGSEGIYDVESGTLTLYPNPASSQVTLSVSGMDGMIEVEIVDMNGRVAGNWQLTAGQMTLDVSTLSQGAYFVRVTGEHQTAVRKLIIK